MLIAKDHEPDRVASTVTRHVLMAVVKRRFWKLGRLGNFSAMPTFIAGDLQPAVSWK